MYKNNKKCQNKIFKIDYTIIIKLKFKFYDKNLLLIYIGGCYV